MYHRNAAISSCSPRGILDPPSAGARRFLKEFDIEFFALWVPRWVRNTATKETGKSPRPVEGRGRKKRDEGVHYLRVRYGIHPLSLGEFSIPATANPRLPPRLTTRGTAELRRRIITFYADFNTRLFVPFPPFHPVSVLSESSLLVRPVTGSRNRRFRDIVRSLEQRRESPPLFLVLYIVLLLFSPPTFIGDAISSTFESNVSECRSG